jgi:hypothetical protein
MSRADATLAEEQQALLALIKSRPIPAGADETYIDRVRSSRGLEVVWMVASWWRRYDLERLAPLTTRALTNAHRFDDAVEHLGRDPDLPAGSGATTIHFLQRHVNDADPLIAAVAATELALTRAGAGDQTARTIAWPCDPWPVLDALLARRAPREAPYTPFTLTVSRSVPGWLLAEKCNRETRVIRGDSCLPLNQVGQAACPQSMHRPAAIPGSQPGWAAPAAMPWPPNRTHAHANTGCVVQQTRTARL